AKHRIAGGEDIAAVLESLATEPPEPRIAGNVELIEKHFASSRLEDIIASLAADGSEWAQKELATLRSKSPQACKVALRQLAESRKLTDFADNMAMEYRIGSRVLVLPDFAEGVRSVIIDKDQSPKWTPPTPEEVSDAFIDSIFAPLPEGEEWTPLELDDEGTANPA
ncbi:MAG: enoyl-CoA hydratase/isomerase family protein, partial [Novosphingobium sp.]|nr:enoyl-CoA hydratase/isomerase family protein [Novosphingobium sp.]